MLLISSCTAEDPPPDKIDGKFSSNPVISEIYKKSIEAVEENTEISRVELLREYDPKYIETNTQVCIVWFPTASRNDRKMTLDDRLTYVSCGDNDASIEDELEFHSFRK